MKTVPGRSMTPYNIPGLIFEVSEEVATQSPKIAVVDNLTLICSSRQEEPRKCPHVPYISRN